MIPIIFLTLIAAGSFGTYKALVIDEPGLEISYAASDQNDVPVQVKTGSGMEEAYRLTRGTRVKLLKDDNAESVPGYSRLRDAEDEREYYIADANLTKSKDDVVLEKELYVRTPVTLYANAEGPEIASFAAKGSKLEVKGYDMLMEDGSVHK